MDLTVKSRDADRVSQNLRTVTGRVSHNENPSFLQRSFVS